VYPLSDAVIEELSAREKYLIPVVEIYPRDVEDFVSLSAPAYAIGRFSTTCFTWKNSTGSYEYKAKVLSFPEVSLFLDKQINSAEVQFSNVARGKDSMSKFVLDNNIKGCWMVLKLLYPDSPEESTILWWGKCDRPGEINSSTLNLSGSQDLGNYKQEIPPREYGIQCPLVFGKPGGDCLGNELFSEKSAAYKQAFEEFSTAGCNKLFSTCTILDNTKFFQGQRVVAVSGQFSYITVEEVVKRVLFWTKRKKIQTVKTDNWSSVNQSEGSEVIPLAFGRCQIQGHPFTWADEGTQVMSLQGFCEGKISAFYFVRSRTQGINIVGSPIQHLGEYGGTGSQELDTLFNGASGYNSKLAYLEIITDGSSPTQVDDAPIITAVIRGLEIPVPDSEGNFNINDWTNNPSFVTRYLLTNERAGKIPISRIDDIVCIDTANDCDELIEDSTNEEAIVLPANELPNYGVTYTRFRSTGRYTAYADMFNNNSPNLPQINSLSDPASIAFPEFDRPQVTWFNPFQPYVLPSLRSVLRQKYTFNGALQEKTSLIDFIYDRVLPTFKGYLAYAPNGKIQIKNRRKAHNAYCRELTIASKLEIPITNIRPWRESLDGYLLIGVALETAEIRELSGFKYSAACNDLPITVFTYGDAISATATNLTGGSSSSPATATVDVFSSSINEGDTVALTFDSGDNAFTVEYSADGIEDSETFARMLCYFLNANCRFNEFLYAYILPSNKSRINIRCESGYLVFKKPLEFDHDIGEEVMRVQAVFENCGEITANQSALFDNIIEDTFKWNNDEQDEVNAVVAKYTSAVDDFHLTSILPRAAWDTIDLEGELLKEEMDLTFVDNYWQAAYLAKSEAIERIDGNLHFSFQTNLLAMRLELGDVVAVRHDSGDGALNYVPCSIITNKIDLNEFTVELSMKLYLSAAFNYHVQPIDPLLTTTLNPSVFPDQPPATTGTTGGHGGGDGKFYGGFGCDQVISDTSIQQLPSVSANSGYSPCGYDIV
jgi:hypothetical protein